MPALYHFFTVDLSLQEATRSRRGEALPPPFVHITPICETVMLRPNLTTQPQFIGKSKED
jgi:hypothetical protein